MDLNINGWQNNNNKIINKSFFFPEYRAYCNMLCAVEYDFRTTRSSERRARRKNRRRNSVLEFIVFPVRYSEAYMEIRSCVMDNACTPSIRGPSQKGKKRRATRHLHFKRNTTIIIISWYYKY